ncbi:MAG TPA: hypothetical protein VFW62_11640 [bacterium]|nr:hypothetical protein [bacterium]
MSPIRTHLGFTWSNDGLNYLVPMAQPSRDRSPFHDDDGFTNDLAMSAAFLGGNWALGFQGQHRMITERGGLRRSDEVELGAWLQRVSRHGKRIETRPFLGLGLVATGPLGGAYLQDRFHRIIQWGRTLDGEILGQLQNQYEGGRRYAPQLKAGGELAFRLSPQVRLLAGAMASVSPGAGASGVQAKLGFERVRSFEGGKLIFLGGIGLRHLRSEEERLEFKGGYPDAESFVEPFGGFTYQRRRFSVAYHLILNVEGSGAHQGAISLGYLLGG